MVKGYASKYLDVNLTDGSVRTFSVDLDLARKMVGGLTYGLYLLWKRTKPGIDPLSSPNLLIFSTGPISGLVGTSRGTGFQIAFNRADWALRIWRTLVI